MKTQCTNSRCRAMPFALLPDALCGICGGKFEVVEDNDAWDKLQPRQIGTHNKEKRESGT